MVLHCAVYKNVPVCEEMPTSCIRVNINGTENVISAALTAGVKKVVFTSSDKAVNPTNVMGSTNILVTTNHSANEFKEKTSKTIFACTRFGNVLGSTGSVLPVF